MAKAGRGSDQFQLRLPEGMRDRLKLAADAEGRSLNAEIVARLEASEDRAKREGLTKFFSEGRKRQNQKLARENAALKARLTRLYEEGGPEYLSPRERPASAEVLEKMVAEKVQAVVDEKLQGYRAKLDRLEEAVAEQLGVTLDLSFEDADDL